MPVIFSVQKVPAIGMLMIPKTLTYVAVGFLGFSRYFRQRIPTPPSGQLRTA